MWFFSYLFWPNPGIVAYGDPHPRIAFVVCGLLLLSACAFRVVRARSRCGSFRRLTHSWTRAALWFGGSGIFLTIARTEGIQYLAMRFWWVIWGGSLVVYTVVQCRRARLLWYEILPSSPSQDLREKYLPHKKQ